MLETLHEQEITAQILVFFLSTSFSFLPFYHRSLTDFVLKVEEISFGFLDFCTPLQPCIVTQDIRVSAYTLAIKVQNSEALKTAGS